MFWFSEREQLGPRRGARLPFDGGHLLCRSVARCACVCFRVTRNTAGGETEQRRLETLIDAFPSLLLSASSANAVHKPRDYDRAVGDTLTSRHTNPGLRSIRPPSDTLAPEWTPPKGTRKNSTAHAPWKKQKTKTKKRLRVAAEELAHEPRRTMRVRTPGSLWHRAAG